MARKEEADIGGHKLLLQATIRTDAYDRPGEDFFFISFFSLFFLSFLLSNLNHDPSTE